MDDLTPLQEYYLALNGLAVFAGVFGGALIIFLLSVIAVRGLASWR